MLISQMMGKHQCSNGTTLKFPYKKYLYQTDTQNFSYNKKFSISALANDTNLEAERQERARPACKPLWNNHCTKHSHCCTKFCWRGKNDWVEGVCKENKYPQLKDGKKCCRYTQHSQLCSGASTWEASSSLSFRSPLKILKQC